MYLVSMYLSCNDLAKFKVHKYVQNLVKGQHISEIPFVREVSMRRVLYQLICLVILMCNLIKVTEKKT